MINEEEDDEWKPILNYDDDATIIICWFNLLIKPNMFVRNMYIIMLTSLSEDNLKLSNRKNYPWVIMLLSKAWCDQLQREINKLL